MSDPTVAGLSLIMETNEEVDQVAQLLRAIGLSVTGEDGYVEVAGPSITLSIMRGAMVEVPRHGGTLLQLDVDDVVAATAAARDTGAAVVQDSATIGGGTSFVQSSTGLTIELRPAR